MKPAPIVRDVVLVGGGHSHALLIRRWAMQPLAGVRLTLVSRDVMTPYSGMLPGLVAGHYDVDEVHIDLRRLCSWAGVRFIRTEMTGVDLERRCITSRDRPEIVWDLLSLDTGSTPDLGVPGAAGHSTPVKPVSAFHARWTSIAARLRADPTTSLSVGVVGSGAGGFELVMAMRHALPRERVHCHWFLRQARPLAERPPRLGARALAVATGAGVSVHTGFDVAAVTELGVTSAAGKTVALDETLWCTGGRGPDWTAQAGLATDSRGFVATDRHLRSVSHPCIFATGDIGTQQQTPSAKAGVFAVRQAPVLFKNIRATLLGRPLHVYRPQRHFLSLMATGDRSAIASRGPLQLEGRAIWQWKDRIDRRFMRRFEDLPRMREDRSAPVVARALLDPEAPSDVRSDTGPGMRCRGCGAKVAAALLDDILDEIELPRRDDILAGVAEAGDAAVISLPTNVLVQSVDQLSAIIDDPWLFGRMASFHALSDVHVSGGHVHSAQLLLTLPHGHERIVRRELGMLMRGIVSALDEEHCALIGGHTAEGDELSVGLVVNAFQEEGVPSRTNAKPNPGDALVLTEPLGIGTLFAALASARARGPDIDTALQIMSRSNRVAASICRAHGVVHMTDVTGFGLCGHLDRLLRGQARSACLEVGSVPLLAGSLALAEAGVHSSLWPSAGDVLERYQGSNALPLHWQRLLCDPQTGGGLLGIVPATRVDACVASLVATGCPQAAVVGAINADGRHSVQLSSVPA